MRPIALALLCAASCAPAAHADIIHFINPAPGQPGHYNWNQRTYPTDDDPSNFLDITRSAAAQDYTWDNFAGDGNVVLQRQINYDFADTIDDLGFATGHQGWWGLEVANLLVNTDEWTASLSDGQPVTAAGGLAWSNRARHVALFVHPGGPWYSLLPAGQRRYIGVLTGSGNYGWIEVERVNGFDLVAHSWAYETTPGVPITAGQIPAPGAGGLLLAAATLRICRRRRAAREQTTSSPAQ